MQLIDGESFALPFFFLWAMFGVFWLLRRKLKLLKKHGFDKTNDYLIELARHGDKEAKTLRRDSRIFVAVGIVGFLIILALGSK